MTIIYMRTKVLAMRCGEFSFITHKMVFCFLSRADEFLKYLSGMINVKITLSGRKTNRSIQ